MAHPQNIKEAFFSSAKLQVAAQKKKFLVLNTMVT